MHTSPAHDAELILDRISDQFFQLDRSWRYVYLNQRAAAQMCALGLDPAALLGQIVWEVFTAVPAEAALRRAMSDRVTTSHEHYYPPLQEWMEDRIFPRADGGLDIFQRYLTLSTGAAAALRRSEESLARAQALSHIGTGSWNVLTGEVVWSRESYRIYGFDAADTTPSGALFFGIVHADDRDRVVAMFEAVVRDRSDYETTFRIVTTAGDTKHIRSVGVCVLDEAGVLVEVVGTVMDITAQHRAEEQLARSERRFRLLAKSITHPVITIDPSYRGAAGPAFSRREQQVLRDSAWGYANHEIAARLGISVRTVEVHKTRGMRKKNMHSRSDIVRYALLHGWFQDP